MPLISSLDKQLSITQFIFLDSFILIKMCAIDTKIQPIDSIIIKVLLDLITIVISKARIIGKFIMRKATYEAYLICEFKYFSK